ncbi:MAG TPA: CpXC domain-containing protein [Spirochaetia bacterium]|nr:CpXC domain-containing protein [Spirochaetia bacterium]
MDLQKRRIACFCENSFDAEVPKSADLAADPQVEEQILNGDFMAVTCPACGKRLTPEFPFHLVGRGSPLRPQGWDAFLVPEEDRVAFLRGKLDYAPGTPTRVVVGFPELAEKVLVFGQGLDDRVIEVMKYYLLTGSAARSEAEMDPVFSYHGQEGGRHVFHVSGLRKGEVAVARLGTELYQKIAADIERRVTEDPFKDFCAPPWVSLRKVSGEPQ